LVVEEDGLFSIRLVDVDQPRSTSTYHLVRGSAVALTLAMTDGDLAQWGWNALDLTEEGPSVARSGGGGGAPVRGRRPTAEGRRSMWNSLAYLGAGVGTRILGRAVDSYWPEKYTGYGKMGRRYAARHLSDSDLIATGRFARAVNPALPSGKSFASEAEKAVAVKLAEQEVEDERAGLKAFNATLSRANADDYWGGDWTGETNRAQATLEYNRRNGRVAAAAAKLDATKEIPVRKAATPAGSLGYTGDLRKSLKKEGISKDMRRYARDHRRRQRALRYARTMPAERFLSAFGTRWSNRYM